MVGYVHNRNVVFQLGLSPLYMVAIGDSKSAQYALPDGYRWQLEQNVTAAVAGRDGQFLKSYGASGYTTATSKAGIDAYLASMVEVEKTPEWVLVNLGSNDATGLRSGAVTYASWSADMGYILDAVHTKWPLAQIRLMRPLHLTFETEYALYNGTWIPDIIATRPTFVGLGPDEWTFLPGHLADVTHPDSSGYVLTGSEWLANLGY